MKIVQEREQCIGCGTCAAICPKHWKMADDGKSTLLDSKINPETKNHEKEVKEIECNKEAAESCPVQIIHLEK